MSIIVTRLPRKKHFETTHEEVPSWFCSSQNSTKSKLSNLVAAVPLTSFVLACVPFSARHASATAFEALHFAEHFTPLLVYIGRKSCLYKPIWLTSLPQRLGNRLIDKYSTLS